MSYDTDNWERSHREKEQQEREKRNQEAVDDSYHRNGWSSPREQEENNCDATGRRRNDNYDKIGDWLSSGQGGQKDSDAPQKPKQNTVPSEKRRLQALQDIFDQNCDPADKGLYNKGMHPDPKEFERIVRDYLKSRGKFVDDDAWNMTLAMAEQGAGAREQASGKNTGEYDLNHKQHSQRSLNGEQTTSNNMTTGGEHGYTYNTSEKTHYNGKGETTLGKLQQEGVHFERSSTMELVALVPNNGLAAGHGRGA